MTGRVVVVGGGIAGLTTAYRLRRVGLDAVVVEAARRVGGKIRTELLDGIPVEAGADSFVTRKPAALDLCRELGLEQELVRPAATTAAVWARGRLVPFPERAAFGIPGSPVGLLRWPGLTLRERLRSLGDLFARRRREEGDEPLGDLVSRRLGPGAARTLVGPLLAGLSASDPARLSVEATFPELARWERDHGSLLAGARAAVRAAEEAAAERPALPLFGSVWNGLSRLVDALVEAVGEPNVHPDAPVAAIRRGPGGRFVVDAPGEAIDADAVVVATPAFETARLVEHLAADAAEVLYGIRYVSTAVVTLVYPPGTGDVLPDGSGFLAPGMPTITACTWVSRKWPHGSHRERAVIRAFVGRLGAEEVVDLGDAELVRAVRADVEAATPMPVDPQATRVVRWHRAMPQYEVGHLARVARAEAAIAAVPGLFVTGAAYRGMGIADCVRAAGETAAAVGAFLRGDGGEHGETAPHREEVTWTS